MTGVMAVLESALIVCTKDRPDEVAELFELLDSFEVIPAVILIVDSSELDLTERAVAKSSLPSEVHLLKSLPGAAHQKNVGLDWLELNRARFTLEVVHFLDDDIRPRPDYFAKVMTIFRSRPDAAVVGGFDINISSHPESKMRQLLGLQHRNGSGFVLPSGICEVPTPTPEGDRCVDFVPGGMQNLRWDVAEHNRFDGRVRIYGDEVEFHLRLRKLGEIVFSPDLGVVHLNATGAKDNNRAVQGYMDGFRWTLSKKHPGMVREVSVLKVTLILILGEALRLIGPRRKRAASSILGHWDFLTRLVFRKPVQQYVDHAGSGPYVNLVRD